MERPVTIAGIGYAGRRRINRNKLHAALCILLSAAVSAALSGWIVWLLVD